MLQQFDSQEEGHHPAITTAHPRVTNTGTPTPFPRENRGVGPRETNVGEAARILIDFRRLSAGVSGKLSQQHMDEEGG